MIKVKVVGCGGYGGGGIVELLLRHPQAEIQTLVAATETGMPMSDLYPHLKGFCDLPIYTPDDPAAQEPADVVFFSTPDGVGMVGIRVGVSVLLLGLGRRGLHLVGVRRQYGSRRGQGKTNGQHQSGRTSAQFVDFSHVPSSFNCCRVSGFACRP